MQTFEQWLTLLNLAVKDRIGVDLFELPDRDWHSDYEDGLSPEEALELIHEEELFF